MSAVQKVRNLARWAWEKDQELVTSGRSLDGNHPDSGLIDRAWVRSCLHPRIEDRAIDRALRSLVESGELELVKPGSREMYRLAKPGFDK
ncbi:hypothetical protein [Arthrobacter caoxuetaonis]|uniref:Uncharacterized protein n=1 Tax=Arthrobacter caoxuetaonis TaxID=2886935 RepID=A0A9X1MGP4_9MICC|nr:hypothetical protein [Arthrobacter caoxuetaonis]MCC3299738.1 hypothetical protein [Arthrobacter caoxuetaonis]USQ59360.1 hypothetical protein NF551_17460 [Arthrobacter caoxuetaonis]